MRKFTSARLVSAVNYLLEMPKEVTTNLPYITIVGGDVLIENFIRIIEYTPERIRFAARRRSVVILGDRLKIKALSVDAALISGTVNGLEFV